MTQASDFTNKRANDSIYLGRGWLLDLSMESLERDSFKLLAEELAVKGMPAGAERTRRMQELVIKRVQYLGRVLLACTSGLSRHRQGSFWDESARFLKDVAEETWRNGEIVSELARSMDSDGTKTPTPDATTSTATAPSSGQPSEVEEFLDALGLPEDSSLRGLLKAVFEPASESPQAEQDQGAEMCLECPLSDACNNRKAYRG
jgi:hypothetical protein